MLIVVEGPDGDITEFPAESAGTVGRYRATIEFPESGRYEWSVIQGWFGPQDLGALDIDATGWSPPPPPGSSGRWDWPPSPGPACSSPGSATVSSPLVSPKPQASVM